MSLVQVSNNTGPDVNQGLLRRKVWFANSGVALQHGQALCLKDPADSTITQGIGMEAELPSTNNLDRLAGFVPENQQGKVGPCLVELVVPRPGEFVQALVSNNAAIADGALLELVSAVPTATATQAVSGRGGLAALTLAAGDGTATDIALSVINAGISNAVKRLVGQVVGGSVASYTDTDVGAERVLKWIRIKAI